MHTKSVFRSIILVLLLLLTGCGGTTTDVPVSSEAPTTTLSSTPTSTETPISTSTEYTVTHTATHSTSTQAPNDPDGDGFTSCEEMHLLTNATPSKMDIYLEIDWTEGDKPARTDLQRLIQVYDSAPIENPNGETGARLHIMLDGEVPAQDAPLSTFEANPLHSQYFNNSGRGYHHVLLMSNLSGNVLGSGDDGRITVQKQNPNQSDTFYVRILAHELGHSLGLERSVFHGVDNYSMSADMYPSIMNPTVLHNTTSIDLSNGSNSGVDFDDWGYLDSNLNVPRTPNLDDNTSCP